MSDSFFLLNGDTFFDIPLSDLAWSRGTVKPLARIALRRLPDTGRHGVVRRDGFRVTAFAARTGAGRHAGHVNGGIYWLRRAVVDHIGEGLVSMEEEVFPKLVAEGHVEGVAYRGAFIDIGVPADYQRSQTFLPEMLRRPALFIDRDGVINEDTGYVHEIGEFRWISGAKEVLKRACDLGWFVFVVTNQGGIGRGFYDHATVETLHAWLRREVWKFGAHITDIRFCPHHPRAEVAGLEVPCDWRKPGHGMINDLMAKHPVDRAASIMVGDKLTDMAAAEAAGITGLHFTGGRLDDLVLPHLIPLPDRKRSADTS